MTQSSPPVSSWLSSRIWAHWSAAAWAHSETPLMPNISSASGGAQVTPFTQ